MTENYTKNEVRNLLNPLMDQIEFDKKQLTSYHEFLCMVQDLNWWQRLVRLPFLITEFMFVRLKESRESKTIIEQMANWAEENPRSFEMYKEFFDGTKNN